MTLPGTNQPPLVLEIDFFAVAGGFVVSAEGDRQANAEDALTSEEVLGLTAFGDRFRGGHVEDELEAVKIGRFIFDRVFRNGIEKLFQEARATARERGLPLRIALRFPANSEILEVPWELLHDGLRFLALDPWTPVVRNFRLRESEIDLAVESPLRVLLTTAGSGGGEPAGPIFGRQVEEVRAALAAAGGRVQIEVAEGGSPERPLTRQRLEGLFKRARHRRLPYHVWHHIGHGTLLRETGGLEFCFLLETADGRIDPVPAARLSHSLAGPGDLKLAVLSLCFSGSTMGLSTELARLNVPAVLGFCGAVVRPAALEFARALYQGIHMRALDDSVTEGRHAMADRRWPLEWALPVLFCRSRGRLELLKGSAVPSGAAAVPEPAHTRVSFGGGPIIAKKVTQIGTVGAPGNGPENRRLDVTFSPSRIAAGEVLQIAEITDPLVDDDFRRRFRELQGALGRLARGEEAP
jgi:hypothetical protein